MTASNLIPKIAIFGASGFAREVADICLALGCQDIVFLDVNPAQKTYFGYPLYGDPEISRLAAQGWLFALGIGDNQLRQKIYSRFSHLPYPNLVHPSATFGAFGQQEPLQGKKGNIICAGTRFTNQITFGNFGIFNLNATVGHDCLIEDFINLAPGVNISGNVHLEKGVYIGTNAVVLQGKDIDHKMRIGSFATVGAGAVVTNDVALRTTVVGIPARPLDR
ncbi:MAG: acetyltransferase [Desulfobulbaceae bacterium]|nr:acetyltransferase [Desulfobulbaceae bacterium]